MSHRYRLQPSADQAPVLTMHCAHARFVWNLALEQNEHARMLGQRADQMAWDRQLAEARRSSWLGEGSSSVQQGALRDLRQGFRNWWSNPAHYRPPTWRSAHRSQQGFVVRDLRVRQLNRKWAELTIPKVGWVKFRLSRPLPTEAKSARVTLDNSGRWHVSLTSPQPRFHRPETRCLVGVDVGVARSLTTSGGEHIDMPVLLSPGEARRRLTLQRKLARQVKGSNRRTVTKRKLAKMSAREADRRKDWVEKATTDLVRRFDVIAVEDLQVTNMVRSGVRKRGLNRSISNQAWAMVRSRLEQKASAATSPCAVIAVPARNTSRRCSGCGHVAAESRESQALFRCVDCGHTANADVNAAINILAAGLAVAGRGATQKTTAPFGVAAAGCEASTTASTGEPPGVPVCGDPGISSGRDQALGGTEP